MFKTRFISMLVLLMTAVTGAWAQEQSETITTTANIVEGTHFTISDKNSYADNWGMCADKGITVTAKNGETITKVVISNIYDSGSVNDGNTSVSSGTKEITNGGGTITVTGVNASTFTFTCSYFGTQFGQFVVYYTETPRYTVTMKSGTEDATNWQGKAGEGKYQALPLEGVFAGTAVTVKYFGTKKVESVKAVKKGLTYPVALSAVTADYVGSVVCSDGNVYPAKTAVPDGCTAVGILGKVTETGHGLILALKDATSQKWNTINGWISTTDFAGTTLKVLPDETARGTNLTSYTALGTTVVSDWTVAQKSDYVAILTNLGSTKRGNDGKTYDGNVNAYITTGVGGTALSGGYWSATVYGNFAWYFDSTCWGGNNKANSRSVRPVLAF